MFETFTDLAIHVVLCGFLFFVGCVITLYMQCLIGLELLKNTEFFNLAFAAKGTNNKDQQCYKWHNVTVQPKNRFTSKE